MTPLNHRGEPAVGCYRSTAHSDDGVVGWVTTDQGPDKEGLMGRRLLQRTLLVLYAGWAGQGRAYNVVATASCDGDGDEITLFVGDHAVLGREFDGATDTEIRWAQMLPSVTLSAGGGANATLR